MSDLKRIIGTNVRSARIASGLTQEQLAERIECAWETISKIERGTNLPSVETLQGIAATLHVSVDDLLSHSVGESSLTRVTLEAKISALVRGLDEDDLPVVIRILEALTDRPSRKT
ncbi:MAG: helix-turn-helix transcriptional regulator [Magnetospirillum sp.]|nr:helix-turn-helix transcriptional regulator [Magnetospirillum sp.]